MPPAEQETEVISVKGEIVDRFCKFCLGGVGSPHFLSWGSGAHLTQCDIGPRNCTCQMAWSKLL